MPTRRPNWHESPLFIVTEFCAHPTFYLDRVRLAPEYLVHRDSRAIGRRYTEETTVDAVELQKAIDTGFTDAQLASWRIVEYGREVALTADGGTDELSATGQAAFRQVTGQPGPPSS